MSTILEALKKSQALKKNLAQQQHDNATTITVSSSKKSIKAKRFFICTALLLIAVLLIGYPLLFNAVKHTEFSTNQYVAKKLATESNEVTSQPEITTIINQSTNAKPVVIEEELQQEIMKMPANDLSESYIEQSQNNIESLKLVTLDINKNKKTITKESSEKVVQDIPPTKENQQTSKEKNLNLIDISNVIQFDDLSKDIKKALPPLTLMAHVYTETPNNRFIILNLKRLTDGDSLDNEIKLITITEKGAILQYNNQAFLLEK